MPLPRCGMGNRQDVKGYRQLIEEATPSLPSIHGYNDVEPCHAALRERVLYSINKVNAQKGEPPRKAHDPNDEWTGLIRTSSRQCRYRSETFCNRVKISLLWLPTQSTLPLPGRGIQRIPERSSSWSHDALNPVPCRDRLETPDPPKECLYQDRPLPYPFHRFLSLLWSCFSPGSA